MLEEDLKFLCKHLAIEVADKEPNKRSYATALVASLFKDLMEFERAQLISNLIGSGRKAKNVDTDAVTMAALECLDVREKKEFDVVGDDNNSGDEDPAQVAWENTNKHQCPVLHCFPHVEHIRTRDWPRPANR